MRYNIDNQIKKEQDALASVVRMRNNCNKNTNGGSLSFVFVLVLSCMPAFAYQQGLLPGLNNLVRGHAQPAVGIVAATHKGLEHKAHHSHRAARHGK